MSWEHSYTGPAPDSEDTGKRMFCFAGIALDQRKQDLSQSAAGWIIPAFAVARRLFRNT